MRMQGWKRVLLWCGMAGASAASGVAADPLDLHDARPRPVAVSFEISPTERPGALDVVYSAPLPARLEPGAAPGQVRVRVPGSAMERLLAEFDPLPGSFDDYLWTFDATTGDVLSAGFQGWLRQAVAFGLFSTRVETRIEVQVGTHDAIGFRTPYTRLGQTVVGVCEPGAADCTRVSPRSLDPRTGYVNAVGTIHASALGGLAAVTFAPLGEAIFSELPAADAGDRSRERALPVVSAPAHASQTY